MQSFSVGSQLKHNIPDNLCSQWPCKCPLEVAFHIFETDIYIFEIELYVFEIGLYTSDIGVYLFEVGIQIFFVIGLYYFEFASKNV